MSPALRRLRPEYDGALSALPGARYIALVRSILPMAHGGRLPELELTAGLLCLGFGYYHDAWPSMLLGAVCLALGAYDLWRERRRRE